MQPGDVYLRAKRWMVLSSGVLTLAVLGQIHYVSDNKDYVLGLKDPTQIANMLAIAVMYFFFQSILYWQSQEQKVKNTTQFRIEMFGSFAIAIAAFGLWLVDFVLSLIDTNTLPGILEGTQYIFLAAALFGLTTALLAYVSLLTGRMTGRLLQKRFLEKTKATAQIRDVLTRNVWTLFFNPHRPQSNKRISFNGDGRIGHGQNENEHSWKVDGEFLEIFNDQGELFSRFIYQPSNNYFQHTNDLDTRSLNDQLIVPSRDLDEWVSWLSRNYIKKGDLSRYA